MTYNLENCHAANTENIAVEELYNHFINFSDVDLKFQRNSREISRNNLKKFNQNVLDGKIHQNITLVDTDDCYESDNDIRWKKEKRYLILDGQHRLQMIEDSISEEILESKYKEKYLKSTLPVRIISKMKFEDLGPTFIANNCGKPISPQDALTFLNTPMSNFVVEFVNKNYNSLGRVFSNPDRINNEGRKIDKEVRISAQLFSGKPRFEYSYSPNKGEDFYNQSDPQSVKTSLETWVKLLNEIPNDKRKKSRAVGCRMLVALLNRDNLQIKNYSEFYKEFERWETEEYQNEDKLIELVENTKARRLYKELCSSHSTKDIKTRLDHIKRNFILSYKMRLIRLEILSQVNG